MDTGLVAFRVCQPIAFYRLVAEPWAIKRVERIRGAVPDFNRGFLFKPRRIQDGLRRRIEPLLTVRGC